MRAIAVAPQKSTTSSIRHLNRKAICKAMVLKTNVRNNLGPKELRDIGCHSSIWVIFKGSEDATSKGYAASRVPQGVTGITAKQSKKTRESLIRSSGFQACISMSPKRI